MMYIAYIAVYSRIAHTSRSSSKIKENLRLYPYHLLNQWWIRFHPTSWAFSLAWYSVKAAFCSSVLALAGILPRMVCWTVEAYINVVDLPGRTPLHILTMS